MIEEIGTVTELRGGMAVIQTEKRAACDSCGSARFCHVTERDQVCIVEAENRCHARVGEKVRVSIPAGSFLKGAFILYLFPLIGLFAGMAAGLYIGAHQSAGNTDILAAAGAVSGLLLFFVFQRLINNRVAKSPTYRPVVAEILEVPSPHS